MKKVVIFILDCLPRSWRDTLVGLKRFKTKNRIYPQTQTVIFFVEKGKWHGGFADRMKGIISLFHYCLCQNISFKINYGSPFDISDFLQSNKYEWQITDTKTVSYHCRESKFMNLIGDGGIERLARLKIKKQIHAYANRDIVPLLNVAYQTHYTWGELFKNLFRPTDELQTAISDCQTKIGGSYVGAVFRFQNLLGDFAEYEYQALNEKDKQNLIVRCRQSILNLQNAVICKRILVTSDSLSFLQSLTDMPFVYVFPSKVVHIDTTSEETHSVYLKSFIDFYLLSEGEAIYAIGTRQMYPSEFPMYAAKVNNIPFERIWIE